MRDGFRYGTGPGKCSAMTGRAQCDPRIGPVPASLSARISGSPRSRSRRVLNTKMLSDIARSLHVTGPPRRGWQGVGNVYICVIYPMQQWRNTKPVIAGQLPTINPACQSTPFTLRIRSIGNYLEIIPGNKSSRTWRNCEKNSTKFVRNMCTVFFFGFFPRAATT